MSSRIGPLIVAGMLLGSAPGSAEGLSLGFTTLDTMRPGGRHSNVRTMRARLVAFASEGNAEPVDDGVIDTPDTWTAFSACAADGTIYFQIGWQSPANAEAEERARSFRFGVDAWRLDLAALGPARSRSINLTARERVSHYNGGLVVWPGSGALGFQAMIDGRMRPFRMQRDGSAKADLAAGRQVFAYGLAVSSDGQRIAYHADYRIEIANADGSDRRPIVSGMPFNFAPTWSPDGRWLMFLSGPDSRSADIVIADARSATLRRIISRNGYAGSYSIMDVPDHHEGSSDVPVWMPDGQSIVYAARNGQRVDIFRTQIDGDTDTLTADRSGVEHVAPMPSPDGRRLAYGAVRNGIRQIAVLDLTTMREGIVTHMRPGTAAIWPKWCSR